MDVENVNTCFFHKKYFSSNKGALKLALIKKNASFSKLDEYSPHFIYLVFKTSSLLRCHFVSTETLVDAVQERKKLV